MKKKNHEIVRIYEGKACSRLHSIKDPKRDMDPYDADSDADHHRKIRTQRSKKYYRKPIHLARQLLHSVTTASESCDYSDTGSGENDDLMMPRPGSSSDSNDVSLPRETIHSSPVNGATYITQSPSRNSLNQHGGQ
ncbi:hypothetical protein LOTGIDRAFT_163331 [Lottia gigantea]|uniref:Uncharacterized protein n=1 Tax=Lottia gigantea TaxID=225164 RepID=V4AE41_LOTGI|nr:hypothetical protein LOTGIDRAFT_163331 [Lottia gigantea]ESO91606.1 hypothetical protein LOTGIDRAFT_163331 [Lottia gigantea]